MLHMLIIIHRGEIDHADSQDKQKVASCAKKTASTSVCGGNKTKQSVGDFG